MRELGERYETYAKYFHCSRKSYVFEYSNKILLKDTQQSENGLLSVRE